MMKCVAVQRLTLLVFLFLSGVWLTSGQDARPATTENKPPTSADENFTLNITEKRTTETNYKRSTAVEVSDKNKETGLFVRVGATVYAQKIDITLRGITGNGRFRASLDAIQRLFERGAVSTSEP